MTASTATQFRIVLAAIVAVAVLGSTAAVLVGGRGDSQLDRALDAIPTVCIPERIERPVQYISVDFVERMRQATWWPEPSDSREWKDASPLAVALPASLFVFDLTASSEQGDYGDFFGYDFEDTDIAINIPCPVGGPDGELTPGDAGPGLGIAVGEFDTEQIERATAADPYWAALRQTATAAGRDYYTYSFLGSNLEKRGPSRILGQGGQLYADSSLALRSQSYDDSLGPLFTAEASAEELAFHQATISAIRRLDGAEFLSARLDVFSAEYPVDINGLTHNVSGQVDGGDAPRQAFAAFYIDSSAAAKAAESIENNNDRLAAEIGTYSVRVDGTLVVIVVDDFSPLRPTRAAKDLLLELFAGRG